MEVPLMDNDNFPNKRTFLAGSNETINAIAFRVALIGKVVVFGCTESLKLVDEDASHVINLDVDLARHVLKVERHLPVVGIGHHREVCRGPSGS